MLVIPKQATSSYFMKSSYFMSNRLAESWRYSIEASEVMKLWIIAGCFKELANQFQKKPGFLKQSIQAKKL